MQLNYLKTSLKTALYAAGALLLGVGAAVAQQQVNLIAGPTAAALPDGSSVPMWGYSCGAAVTGSTANCAALSSKTGWSPVIITVSTGQDLTINLTNNLSFSNGNSVPTSLMIVGQLGGGLGTRRPPRQVLTTQEHRRMSLGLSPDPAGVRRQCKGIACSRSQPK